MSAITLEQFEQLLNTNVLTDPPMYVRNNTFPRGQISFRVLGSDFKMRDVIVPVSGAAVDLTIYAPLRNLLASSELRKVFESRQLKLVNPQDMPEPNDQKFPEYTKVNPVTAGDTHITGLAPDDTQVQAVINGEIVAVFTEAGGAFSIPVTGLTAGATSEVSFIKDKFETKKVSVTVLAKPDQVYPQPTFDPYTIFDDKVSGTTIAGASVVLKNDGDVMDAVTADPDGKYELTVTQPAGVLTLTFTAEGYTSLTVTVDQADRVAHIGMQIPDYLDEHLVVVLTEVQPVPVHVEIEIAGQPLITDVILENTLEHEVICGEIKGDVKVTVKSTGFEETTVTKTPEKLTFGAVVVHPAYETNTVVTGTVAALATANDIKAELVTLAGTKTVDVINGVFSFTVDPLEDGPASVTFTSAFYNAKTTDFDVLPLQVQATPTALTVYVGETEINGTGEVDAEIFIGGNSVGNVMLDGSYSLSGPAMTAAETLTFRKENFADKTLVVTPTPLSTFTDPVLNIVADDTTVVGTTEPNTSVACVDANATVTSGSDGAFTLTLKAPAVEAAKINITLTKRGFTNKSIEYTVAAKPAE